MIQDASQAHAGELALDGAAVTGKPELAAEWARLLVELDRRGQIVRQEGGRNWLAYVECDLEDVGTIARGDLHGFLESGTLSGGMAIVVLFVVCPGAWRTWLADAVEWVERRTRALVSVGILGDQILVRPTPAAIKWKPARGKPWRVAESYGDGLRAFYAGRD